MSRFEMASHRPVSGRDYWTPRFEVETLRSITGQEWPAIQIIKWEENDLGERRLAGRVIIPSDEVARRAEDLSPKVPA